MERNSLGAFIATLRKANGMTQKELAEKLNVSDKSVSRWERDDGAPDLSLIPVIAEIFDVTCDELLRGQRRPAAERAQDAPADRSPETDASKTTAKSDKQRQRILSASLTSYRNRSFISLGTSALGLLAAMICNMGFNRAYIGFLAASAFYLTGVICQAIFLNQAFLAVADEDLAGPETGLFRCKVITLAEKSFSLTLILFAFSLPLIIYPRDTYMGLSASSWFTYGILLYASSALLLCIGVCYFLNHTLLKRGFYTLPEKAARIYHHNFKLKGKCALLLASLFFLTCILQGLLTGGWDAGSMTEGTKFYDYESFKTFMEQETEDSTPVYSDASVEITAPCNVLSPDGTIASENAELQAEEVIPGGTIYYDQQGNVISEEEALRRTITDAQGNVVCEYQARNASVWSIRYGHANGDSLPITVYTKSDLVTGQNRLSQVNAIFFVIYLLEAAGVLILYFRKRAH